MLEIEIGECERLREALPSFVGLLRTCERVERLVGAGWGEDDG